MMVMNSQEVVRQQHLRDILGKKEGKGLNVVDVISCLGIFIFVFLRLFLDVKNALFDIFWQGVPHSCIPFSYLCSINRKEISKVY